jgi:hypothetical protein
LIDVASSGIPIQDSDIEEFRRTKLKLFLFNLAKDSESLKNISDSTVDKELERIVAHRFYGYKSDLFKFLTSPQKMHEVAGSDKK